MKIRKRIAEPRDTSLTIRMSRGEKRALKALADSSGISVGGYLLGLALGDFKGGCPEGNADPEQLRMKDV